MSGKLNEKENCMYIKIIILIIAMIAIILMDTYRVHVHEKDKWDDLYIDLRDIDQCITKPVGLHQIIRAGYLITMLYRETVDAQAKEEKC